MIHDIDGSTLAEVRWPVIEHGMDGLSEGMTILHIEAMKREQVLQVSYWERTKQSLGYANGYKNNVRDTQHRNDHRRLSSRVQSGAEGNV